MIAQKGSVWSGMPITNGVRECVFPNHRIVVWELEAPWRKSVKDRLDHICRLQIGWDGYKGRSVDFSTANFALNILESVCNVETPVPGIVPGVSGDLQIEWHTEAWDLEIDVLGPYRVDAWRHAVASGDEEQLELTNDFTAVRKWVGDIAESMIAAHAAAA